MSDSQRSDSSHSSARRRVAIACQGGGSHGAFAAGVLAELLSPGARHGRAGTSRLHQRFAERFELVGLSGSSTGALCAALAWRSLVDPKGPDVEQRLLRFWREVEVHDVTHAIANTWLKWWLPEQWVPEQCLRTLLGSHLDLGPLTPDQRSSAPALFVGASDVGRGERAIVQGEALTYAQLLGAAALPSLFRTVQGGRHLCGDGLFTTNPPVREFTDLEEKPDEIWIVQIHSQPGQHDPPGITRDLVDRSNELTAHLSMTHELHAIETMNRLLEKHSQLGSEYQQIRLRVVELRESAANLRLDSASKLDRRSRFIERLIDCGREAAAEFFEEHSRWQLPEAVPSRRPSRRERGPQKAPSLRPRNALVFLQSPTGLALSGLPPTGDGSAPLPSPKS